jgi:hypothetical protein
LIEKIFAISEQIFGEKLSGKAVTHVVIAAGVLVLLDGSCFSAVADKKKQLEGQVKSGVGSLPLKATSQ